MTELMRELYRYGSKARITCGLEDYEQYRESQKCLERNLQALRDLLTPEALQKLENYLAEQQVLNGLDQEAAFCAGFSIGQELSRV